ncbi:MAG: helix-turn-helix domain-containing protein [Blastocatellia bacterium]|nr:helix-turn-helix domain-containing protein [Blastocatellia bacterium]
MDFESENDSDQVCNILRRFESSGFMLSESVSKKDITVPAHSHEQAHITFVLEGLCCETYMRKTRDLAPLNVTFFHPGESHALRFSGEAFRSFDLEFDCDWLDRLLDIPLAPASLTGNHNNSIAGLMARLYKEFKDIDDVSHIAIEGLTLEILAGLVRASKRVKTKKAPPWLRLVVEKINDEFDRPLTLSEVARSVGVHPSHLAQVFREHHDCTLGEFIRHIRIERAIQQMTCTDASLVDISLATGFSDQSHFSRVFKRATGMPPAEFRHLHLDTKFVQNTRRSFKTSSDE